MARLGCLLGVMTLLAAACAQPADVPAPPIVVENDYGFGYRLQARGGVHNDGSGREGLAVLLTLRDEHGAGPASPWSTSIADTSGQIATALPYDDSSVGSHAAWWWQEVPLSSERHFVKAVAGDAALGVSFVVEARGGLSVPVVDLGPDARLRWEGVPGARAYRCNIYSGARLEHSTLGQDTACDVSQLPAGAYKAAVLAYSVDLGALAADSSQAPPLPDTFDVSEGRLAFARVDGEQTIKAFAAGGSIQFGTANPGLALWLGITRADGTPTAESWAVEVVGPGLPLGAPLKFTYPASTGRHLAWTYDAPAEAGQYSLVARSSSGALSAVFSVGEPRALGGPQDVVAEALANGGAKVRWRPVDGARSYFTGVWARDTGKYSAGSWTSVAEAQFAAGAFTPGVAYDVYVAATDADMQSGVAPTQVSVSENTYYPAGFVGR